MKNQERIDKIRQFQDLARERISLFPHVEKPTLEGLVLVLTGHIGELLKMVDEQKGGIVIEELTPEMHAALRNAFFGPVIPRQEPRPSLDEAWGVIERRYQDAHAEEPRPVLTTDCDEYGMFNFSEADWDEMKKDVVEFTEKHILPWAKAQEEPTADEILKHTKSCDFRRGLKTCTCA